MQRKQINKEGLTCTIEIQTAFLAVSVNMKKRDARIFVE
jgi:hypothetical protein